MAINNKYLHTVYSHSIIRLLHTVRFVVNLLNSGFRGIICSSNREFPEQTHLTIMCLHIPVFPQTGQVSLRFVNV